MTARADDPATSKIDIHDTETEMTRTLARLKAGETGIPKESLKAILDFVKSREREVSRQRTLTYLRTLPLSAAKLGPDFLHPNRDTPAKLREATSGLAGWTVMSYWTITVTFWRWMYARQEKDFPSFLHLTVGRQYRAYKTAGDVLTPEEVRRIADATVTARDKALVLCLYESGTRAGEILGLRNRDVTRSDHGGFLLHVDGKTGPRTVPLFESAVPALSAWIACHPKKDEPNAPLWCGLQATDRLGEPMTYAGSVKAIRLAARRAGITKRTNLHIFRHSRATTVSQNPNVSTSIMEKFFGWTPGSPMAATYVHISGREVEDAMARAIGVEKVEAPKPSSSIPRTCGRCSFLNDSASKYCGQCASPLDLATVDEVHVIETNAKTLGALLRNPKVAEYLARELAKAKP